MTKNDMSDWHKNAIFILGEMQRLPVVQRYPQLK